MKHQTLLWLLLVAMLSGCASNGRTREIAWGMLVGAAVGAAVGHQFVHHGQYRQYESQNTLATAAVFALGTGAVLDWHYGSLQRQQVYDIVMPGSFVTRAYDLDIHKKRDGR